MKIFDFDKFNLEQKKYGGSDKKYSIKVEDTYFMIKEPVETQIQNGLKADYSNTCLSEYLGSHIYQILGFKAQNTFLGTFTCSDGKKRLCVACEDFTDNKNMGTEGLFLQEFDSYINDWSRICKDYGFKERHKNKEQKNHGFLDEIEEILDNDLYLKYQPEFKKMFYDMFVVDAFLANRDRHNHNWGFMVSIHPYGNDMRKVDSSPIYDNGGALYPNANDLFLSQKAQNLEREIVKNDYPTSNICECYKSPLSEDDNKSWMNRISYYKYMHSLKNENLNKAILRMTPIIEKALPKISELINDMQESGVITNIRAEAYKKILDTRFNILIKEPYLELKKIQDGGNKENIEQDEDIMDLE